MAIGNRVFLKRPMPSQELLDGFADLPAANIADTMGRSCAMNPRIRLMSGFQGIMVGPALTVKARAGDNLFLHQALDMAQPGDIIVLEAGDLVPADARILESANLKADESAMTGESVPVSKQAIESLPEETVMGDRKNMVISSTVITNGRATCVVTSTGMDTEVGRIAQMLSTDESNETPLQKKMAEISKVLSIICVGVCVVMFGVGLIGIFLTRFFIEFIKLDQEAFEQGMLLNMGQLLSIPFILLGIYMIYRGMHRSPVDPDTVRVVRQQTVRQQGSSSKPRKHRRMK